MANARPVAPWPFTRDPFYNAMKLDPGGVCECCRVTAQHLAMDAHVLPDSISIEAAVTIEPWSCVLSGLKVCHIQPGDTVAVVGAGFMGQGFVHMAPLFGAGKVIAIDYLDWRLEQARSFGATHTINPRDTNPAEALRAANRGRLADTVVVTAPFAPAWDSAMACVHTGGCLHLGAPLPPGTDWVRDGHRAYFDQITVTSRYSSDHTDTYSYIRLLEAGRIAADRAISHRFDIAGSAEAFRLLVEAEKITQDRGLPPRFAGGRVMLDALKQEVCEQNHELPKAGLVVGSGGNVSARCSKTGHVVIKPSGVKFDKLTPETMVVVDLDGSILDGAMRPSVDTGIHLYIYRHRPDVFGIAHSHSPYATSFAARGERIPAVLTPITHMIGRDVPCSRYATPGEVDTGQAILEAADGGYAALVRAHGVFTMENRQRKRRRSRCIWKRLRKPPIWQCCAARSRDCRRSKSSVATRGFARTMARPEQSP